jgi:hypothetical protein
MYGLATKPPAVPPKATKRASLIATGGNPIVRKELPAPPVNTEKRKSWFKKRISKA